MYSLVIAEDELTTRQRFSFIWSNGMKLGFSGGCRNFQMGRNVSVF